jgi:hypothetical protein
LHDAVRNHIQEPPHGGDFEIIRIASVRGTGGAITYYDVCIKP